MDKENIELEQQNKLKMNFTNEKFKDFKLDSSILFSILIINILLTILWAILLVSQICIYAIGIEYLNIKTGIRLLFLVNNVLIIFNLIYLFVVYIVILIYTKNKNKFVLIAVISNIVLLIISILFLLLGIILENPIYIWFVFVLLIPLILTSFLIFYSNNKKMQEYFKNKFRKKLKNNSDKQEVNNGEEK